MVKVLLRFFFLSRVMHHFFKERKIEGKNEIGVNQGDE